jgi:hypothetical protein
MPSVFVSYSSHDKKFVNVLTKELNDRGIITWVDYKQIKVGQPIPRRISEGIISSDYFLIVISSSAVHSQWVENELNSAYFKAAQNKRDSILPILLEKIDLPLLLKPLKYADFSESFDSGMKDLLQSMKINEAEIPFLNRQDRRARIISLLSEVNQFGELPSEAIAFVEDESYIDLFEKNLHITENRRVLLNSIYAIEYLAGAWDGRCIRRHSSIQPLLNLYNDANQVDDFQLKYRIIRALCQLDSFHTKEFLLGLLESEQPDIIAEILSSWQDMHEWQDAYLWLPRIVPILHRSTTRPQEQCVYYDIENIESDYRYWVFRLTETFSAKSSTARSASKISWSFSDKNMIFLMQRIF